MSNKFLPAGVVTRWVMALMVAGLTACAPAGSSAPVVTVAVSTATTGGQPATAGSRPENTRPSAPTTTLAASTSIPATPTLGVTAAPTQASLAHQVALDILQKMTLEQKVGQVYMLGFDGASLNDSNRALIHDLHLGGVTLFGRNVVNPAQLARLVQDLQSIADPVPLFISIDQEGGLVVRVTDGATIFPGNMALGATGDPTLARQVAEATAQELLAMGVNMNLAPVVDVNSNPLNPVIGIRSFGSSVQAVEQFGVATVEGLQNSGVSAVAKHFPGHGATATDSHLDLPVVPSDLDHLQREELPPFRAAIGAGVDSIMTAHVYLPKIEPDLNTPATLSKHVLTGLLRQTLGFQGLIQTDALDMGAIKKYRTSAEASVVALEAGADMLLVAGITAEDRALLPESPKALLAAVRSGRVSEARLDESVLRILETKVRRGIIPTQTGQPAPGLSVVGSKAHRDLALDIARKAITLIRDDAHLLPLNKSKHYLVVEPDYPTRSLVEEEGQAGSLAAAIRPFAPVSGEWNVPAVASQATLGQIAQQVKTSDGIILATYDLNREPSQVALAQALQATGRPIVAVTLRGPYDASSVPQIGTFIAAYGDRPVNLQAAAEVLFGVIQPTGKLPVQLP